MELLYILLKSLYIFEVVLAKWREEIFIGSAHGVREYDSLNDVIPPDQELEADDDEETDNSSQIIYMASFDELGGKYIQYETIIWLSISLLLVLAWGVGIIMLLYLPIKRYVLQKDFSSRRLYVTPTEIVYKVSRPSYVPCWKRVKTETRVPLSLVIDIITEQGWLQSLFGLHTFRVESISRGKAAPVDELQVQGLSNPGLLRKPYSDVMQLIDYVLLTGDLTEASKAIRDAKTTNYMSSLNERLASWRTPSKKWKVENSPSQVSAERLGFPAGELLHRLSEVEKSVKKIESLVDKSQFPESK